ncbi:hypothetical protein PVAND_011841 [Polypedilum vanderplanki]|uniref:5-hydroxyisourate hydrolase n=1 Tax=Polypedilum vanderplanki TaxID=319348 RepID=A0A9J6CJU5_POLVA|nr:hypothetical protein PVAND_011841 [Polypedilum vanderplanki]
MSNKLPLSTHVLDTTVGQPGKNMKIKLFKSKDNYWASSSTSFVTDENGRFGEFLKIDDEVCGTYKLKFEVEEYFKSQEKECLYPFVEIVFKISSSNEHYHIPLIITPYSYSTYRGS